MKDKLSDLLDATGVRKCVRKLVTDFQKFRQCNTSAVWPTQNKTDSNEKSLYFRLYRLRCKYDDAVRGAPDNPFTIDDLRLLAHRFGRGGPQDHLLGDAALGSIEKMQGRWRWTFKDIESCVGGEWHDSEAAAVADLKAVQSLLFPPDLPKEEWFDKKLRYNHLQRVQVSAQKRQTYVASDSGKHEPDLATRMAYPHDARTLSNDFPGLRNLGDTCWLNAVLQCIFHCEPLASNLFSAARQSGVIKPALQDLFAEYVASGVSTADVISPVAFLDKFRRQSLTFAVGRQQDAHECLRHILQYTGLGQEFCDCQAQVADGSVVICFAPEVAQISAESGPLDAKALLLEATTGDGALGKGAQALIIRLENTYEQGGDKFWVDAEVEWPEDSLTLTVANDEEPQVEYDVQGYLVHKPPQFSKEEKEQEDLGQYHRLLEARRRAFEGRNSGHYIAYFKHGAAWYRADDSNVEMLPEKPKEFPYVVFLARSDRGRPAHAAALQKRLQEVKKARHRAPRRQESAPTVKSAPVATPSADQLMPRDSGGLGYGSKGAPARDRSGRIQERDRSGRAQEQDRSGRAQERDFSGRVQQRSRLDKRVDRAWGNSGNSDNRDHSRRDTYGDRDNPCKRFCENYGRYRKCPDVTVRAWDARAEPSGPLQCMLCPHGTDFYRREDWLQHVDEEHGGSQRYRNAYLSLMQLSPHVVSGQECRAIVANFAEFYSRSATDWENFTPDMVAALNSEDGLRPEDRWEPRHRAACVFCARCKWAEELHRVFIAGDKCFMANPNDVWNMLKVERYAERWPLIALTGELEASSVTVSAPHKKKKGECNEYRVLLHKRRVTDEQAKGTSSVHVCADCKEAFEGPKPWLCRYALANDLWLGRWCPLFRDANLSHQMLLALARAVSTKIVLRPDGGKSRNADSTHNWQFAFDQSGMVGTAILFQNADCGPALRQFPCDRINESFAVTFVGAPTAGDAQAQAKEFVATKIAKLKVDRREFDAQAVALQKYNEVYHREATYDQDLLASWVPDPNVPVVPSVVLDAVLAVPLEDSPGQVVAEGPADATAAGEQDRLDADISAARDERVLAVFEPEVRDLNEKGSGDVEVTALMQQLEELDEASRRSVAAEAESLLASDAMESGAGLMDEDGRRRIAEMAQNVRQRCKRLCEREKKGKLQEELQKTATGGQEWQVAQGAEAAADSSGTVPHMLQPRGRTPLSYWDSRIWTMARPTLWRFGDAALFDPRRNKENGGTSLLVNEWMVCMLDREELEYDMPDDDPEHPFRACTNESGEEVNRFRSDWVSLHLFESMRVLSAQQESFKAYVQNGGMKFAKTMCQLTAEQIAAAARGARPGDGIQAIAQNKHTSSLVRDALNIVQMATAHVVGTDGHRRLCRHEGFSYTVLFGPPLVFCTPNLADSKQPLLLIMQNQEVCLDGTRGQEEVLPKYRDMLLRLARDPVGQTRVFHLMMRLFFQHVLGVRPDCIESRRGSRRPNPREWCTDGMAASACAPGIFGPVAAFRGEVEAQGRGSLHPHVLVWLVQLPVGEVVDVLRRDKAQFQLNLRRWMKATVAASESITQCSVRSLPRRFGDHGAEVQPLGFSAPERRLSMYDGESELDLLKKIPEQDRTDAQVRALQQDPAEWCRPWLPLRAPNGSLLSSADEGTVVRESVYKKPISDFAVGQCPGYRRHGPLKKQDPVPPDGQSAGSVVGPQTSLFAEARSAEEWQDLFGKDVRSLASEIFVHICGESCHKYSGPSKVQHICRHGYYYIVVLGDWADRKNGIGFRRRGKPLRHQIFIVQCTTNGMQGRLLHIQEHPFEVQTNYTGAGCMRCNFDVQDLRRVLPEHLWKLAEDQWPCLPVDAAREKELGYMGVHELDGDTYVERTRDESSREACQWENVFRPEEWRQQYLNAFAADEASPTVEPYYCTVCQEPHHEHAGEDMHSCACLQCECAREGTAACADAINTGFYVNCYTTKQAPTLEPVLEPLRQQLQRLEEQHAREKEELESRRARDEPLVGKEMAKKLHKERSLVSDAFQRWSRFSAAERRCKWKSGSEMLFALMFEHLTFASHRCWTVYIKLGVAKACEAHRTQYGQSVRHASKKADGTEVLQYTRQGFREKGKVKPRDHFLGVLFPDAAASWLPRPGLFPRHPNIFSPGTGFCKTESLCAKLRGLSFPSLQAATHGRCTAGARKGTSWWVRRDTAANPRQRLSMWRPQMPTTRRASGNAPSCTNSSVKRTARSARLRRTTAANRLTITTSRAAQQVVRR